MFSRLYSWLVGDRSNKCSAIPPRQSSRCSPYPSPRAPRTIRTSQPSPPPSVPESSQSLSPVIDEKKPGPRPTTRQNPPVVAEKADRFRNISEFVNLTNLESRSLFKDHKFISALPLTTPFFRAIIDYAGAPVQLPPHRRYPDATPINNTQFVPPKTRSSRGTQLALLPSKRWLWSSHEAIRSGLFLDYLPGHAQTLFKFGVIKEYPVLYLSRTFHDTRKFLKEAHVHRNKSTSLHGSVVLHPINATMHENDAIINYEPPHHSFWISASPSMPECLKVLVKCAYTKLHNEGIIHGDVELHNILITPKLDVFIHDFGDTPSVRVHLNGTTTSFPVFSDLAIAEKIVVDILLNETSEDESIFTVMPGQSRGDLVREVQDFLFKLDSLEQYMFAGPALPSEYREALDIFEAAIPHSPISPVAPPATISVTPDLPIQPSPNRGKGKRKANEDIFPCSRRKRARVDEEEGEQSDSDSSHTLHSDSEESARCSYHTQLKDPTNGDVVLSPQKS